MSSPAAPASLAAPADSITAPGALRATGIACALAIALVWLLGRDQAPTVPAALGLLGIAVLTLGLTKLQQRTDRGIRVARAAGLFAVGLCAAPVGWFFGPHSEFYAIIMLGIMVLGVASTPGREGLAWLPSWAGAVGLSVGQATVAIATAAELIPNVSLVPWRAGATAAGTVLLVALPASWTALGFLAARRFRTRYHALEVEVDQGARAAAVRDALLEEARHEYMRALTAGRTGRHRAAAEARAQPSDGPLEATPDPQAMWDSMERTVRETFATETRPTPDASRVDVSSGLPVEPVAGRATLPEIPRAPASSKVADGPMVRTESWADAYRGKLLVQQTLVVLGCAAGVTGAYFILHDPVGIARAIAGMVAVAALALLHRFLVARTGRDTIHWPWVVIGAISVVAISAYGIHSALAAFLVLGIFIGGLFRGSDHATGINRRSAALGAISLSHLVTFLLLWTGVIEDHGLFLLRPPEMPFYEPVVHHAVLQATFVASFVISGRVDRDFRRLRDRVTASANEAAVQEVLLATASAKLAQLETATAAGLFAGQTVGAFTLGARRASGGMGEVYDAVHPESGARAAVKLVRVDVVSDPAVLEHFAHEIDALRRVESPFVARVLDAGGLDAGLPYVAMELIEGPSLGDVLRKKPVLTREDIRALAHDVGRGLSALHRAGVVHRDIKPQNLLRASEEDDAPWKIVDLGVAHIEGVVRAEMAIVGTPRYMAPEQFVGGDVDGRADTYALSLVLYRALTGRPAFLGERVGPDGLFLSPLPPRWLAAMPPDVELCLRIGTATRPEDRFASAESLLDAFTSALDERLSDASRRRAEELLTREPWASPDSPGYALKRGGAA